MRNNLIAGIVLYLTLTASEALSQEEMTSNGRYLSPAFCFGVVASANMAIPLIAENTSLPQQFMNSPFSEDQIELLRKRAIDMSKWEGSYTNWNSDADNGGEYIMNIAEAHLGKSELALLKILFDKIEVCYLTFAPKN